MTLELSQEAIVTRLLSSNEIIKPVKDESFKEDFTSILLKLLQHVAEEEVSQNSLYEISIIITPKPDNVIIRKENCRLISFMKILGILNCKYYSLLVTETLFGSKNLLEYSRFTMSC